MFHHRLIEFLVATGALPKNAAENTSLLRRSLIASFILIALVGLALRLWEQHFG